MYPSIHNLIPLISCHKTKTKYTNKLLEGDVIQIFKKYCSEIMSFKMFMTNYSWLLFPYNSQQFQHKE